MTLHQSVRLQAFYNESEKEHPVTSHELYKSKLAKKTVRQSLNDVRSDKVQVQSSLKDEKELSVDRKKIETSPNDVDYSENERVKIAVNDAVHFRLLRDLTSEKMKTNKLLAKSKSEIAAERLQTSFDETESKNAVVPSGNTITSRGYFYCHGGVLRVKTRKLQVYGHLCTLHGGGGLTKTHTHRNKTKCSDGKMKR